MKSNEYRDQFLARVKQARGDRSQSEMAKLLGIKQDRYKQYETVSLMPHSLIPQFCKFCRVKVDWLIGKKTKEG